jgi:hypothetical protein
MRRSSLTESFFEILWSVETSMVALCGIGKHIILIICNS